MVSVASAATDERLPVAVERFDAAGGRVMLAECDDGVEVLAERVVELAHRDVRSLLSAIEHVPKAGHHRVLVRCFEDPTQLLDDLVGAGELAVEREESMKAKLVR